MSTPCFSLLSVYYVVVIFILGITPIPVLTVMMGALQADPS